MDPVFTYESWLLKGAVQAQCLMELMETEDTHVPTLTPQHRRHRELSNPTASAPANGTVTALHPGFWVQPWEQAEAQGKWTAT